MMFLLGIILGVIALWIVFRIYSQHYILTEFISIFKTFEEMNQGYRSLPKEEKADQWRKEIIYNPDTIRSYSRVLDNVVHIRRGIFYIEELFTLVPQEVRKDLAIRIEYYSNLPQDTYLKIMQDIDVKEVKDENNS